MYLFLFKQKTAYELRISDWSSDVCSSDLPDRRGTQFFSLLQRLWQSVVLKKQADEKIASQIEAGSKFECALDPGQRFRHVAAPPRSEERRVGKEGVSTCRSRWSP